ncbi:unnamed protein product [Rotaria magnacalcarata]|uniref:SWIM-type domain-containing protein n=1 Tax=Rotaria magnacalcarata TaxID=392030 RepID=A0A8S3FKA0_9BILA|nr:unnamed protein product [Rotaria magnacalcarata]
MYQLQQWISFDEFVAWLKSCWLVCPLNSCTCPSGLKYYICKHSIGLAMLLNKYEVNGKTHLQLLGKRRGKVCTSTLTIVQYQSFLPHLFILFFI